MMIRKPSPECLANHISTKCMVWNGQDYPQLDIKKGDSLEWVLDRIVQNLSAPAQEDKTVTIGGVTQTRTSNIVERKIEVKDEFMQGRHYMRIKADPVVNNLPDDYYLVGSRTIVRSRKGEVLASGSSPNMDLQTNIDDYPVTLDYTMFVNGPKGNGVLSTVTEINSGTDTKQITLKDNSISDPDKNMRLDDAVKMLADEIRVLKNRM